MKSLEKIEIEMSVEEVEALIKEHVLKKHPGYKVDDIDFTLKDVYDESDWQGQYPPTTVVGGVDIVLIKGKG